MKYAIALDRKITEVLRFYGRPALPFWKFIAARGMWGFVAVWIFVAYMGWMVWWKPFLPLVLSYITLLITQAIVKRERQNFEKLSGYKMWIRTYSFPSGHSTESAAFACTLALAPLYPTHALFYACSFSVSLLAALIMYSRIAVGVHYVTDILAGLCLGLMYAIAFL